MTPEIEACIANLRAIADKTPMPDTVRMAADALVADKKQIQEMEHAATTAGFEFLPVPPGLVARPTGPRVLLSEVELWKQRAQVAEADAARWWWIRKHAEIVGEGPRGVYRWQFSLPDVESDSIEADVDAAILAETQEEPKR
jgi:hypothetical protein